MVQVIRWIWISAISSGHVFSFVCLFTAICRNAFGSNSTICHQFRGNSVLVNERDGGGNVSITAGLVLNELHMYLLSLLVCVCVCVYVCVQVCAGVCMHACFCCSCAQTLHGQKQRQGWDNWKKKWIQCLHDNVCACVWDSCVMINGLIADLAELTPPN